MNKDFGPFQSVREFKPGVQGTVFAARKAGSSEAPAFAVRTFRPDLAITDEEIAAELAPFASSIVAMQSLAATGAVVKIYASGTVEGVGFYVTDLFATPDDGQPSSVETLAIFRRRSLSDTELADVLRGIATALQAIHATGRGHGNLKSSNVFLTSLDTLAKVQARLADPTGPIELDGREQADDLRALGAILHELVLHRKLPRNAATLPESAKWIGEGRDGKRWRDLCSRLVGLGPTPIDLTGLIDELAGAAPEEPATEAPVPTEPGSAAPARSGPRPGARAAAKAAKPKVHPARNIIAGAVIVIALAGGAWLYFTKPPATPGPTPPQPGEPTADLTGGTWTDDTTKQWSALGIAFKQTRWLAEFYEKNEIEIAKIKGPGNSDAQLQPLNQAINTLGRTGIIDALARFNPEADVPIIIKDNANRVIAAHGALDAIQKAIREWPPLIELKQQQATLEAAGWSAQAAQAKGAAGSIEAIFTEAGPAGTDRVTPFRNVLSQRAALAGIVANLAGLRDITQKVTSSPKADAAAKRFDVLVAESRKLTPGPAATDRLLELTALGKDLLATIETLPDNAAEFDTAAFTESVAFKRLATAPTPSDDDIEGYIKALNAPTFRLAPTDLAKPIRDSAEAKVKSITEDVGGLDAGSLTPEQQADAQFVNQAPAKVTALLTELAAIPNFKSRDRDRDAVAKKLDLVTAEATDRLGKLAGASAKGLEIALRGLDAASAAQGLPAPFAQRLKADVTSIDAKLPPPQLGPKVRDAQAISKRLIDDWSALLAELEAALAPLDKDFQQALRDQLAPALTARPEIEQLAKAALSESRAITNAAELDTLRAAVSTWLAGEVATAKQVIDSAGPIIQKLASAASPTEDTAFKQQINDWLNSPLSKQGWVLARFPTLRGIDRLLQLESADASVVESLAAQPGFPASPAEARLAWDRYLAGTAAPSDATLAKERDYLDRAARLTSPAMPAALLTSMQATLKARTTDVLKSKAAADDVAGFNATLTSAGDTLGTSLRAEPWVQKNLALAALRDAIAAARQDEAAALLNSPLLSTIQGLDAFRAALNTTVPVFNPATQGPVGWTYVASSSPESPQYTVGPLTVQFRKVGGSMLSTSEVSIALLNQLLSRADPAKRVQIIQGFEIQTGLRVAKPSGQSLAPATATAGNKGAWLGNTNWPPDQAIRPPDMKATPVPASPIQNLSPDQVNTLLAGTNLRLPTTAEWQSAVAVSSGAPTHLRGPAFAALWDSIESARTNPKGDRSYPYPGNRIFPTSDASKDVRPDGASDTPFFKPVNTRSEQFEYLIGNVAEFVNDGGSIAVIGASCLSNPSLDPNQPQRLDGPTAKAFADVGFRLAFTATGESQTPIQKLQSAARDPQYAALLKLAAP